MGNNIRTYEVKVEVRKNRTRRYSYRVGRYIEDRVTKMFHVDARTPRQAMQKSKKHGRPISACKVNVEKMMRSVETLLQREPYGINNPYPNAISMDEMIWRRKNTRAERIKNRRRDKIG